MNPPLSARSRFAGPIGFAIIFLMVASCGKKPSASIGESSKEPSPVNKQNNNDKKQPEIADQGACSLIANTLAHADFDSWKGWPAGCDLATLEKTFQFAQATSTIAVGRGLHPTTVHRAELPGASQPLVVWLRDAAIVRASLRYPDVDDPAAVINKLGEPNAKLDAVFGSVPTPKPKAEWVFAERGITLLMSSDASKILETAVYPPTSVEAYTNLLHHREPPREME